jgi:hypothetical protein
MHILDDVCAIFKISPRTLYRWCSHAMIIPHEDPSDYRRKYLDNDQVLLLARLHYRVVTVNGGPVYRSTIERLETRVVELENRARIDESGSD